MDNYDTSDIAPKAVFFRKHATERLVAAVRKCFFPLDTERDVASFMECYGSEYALAEKSRDKLWEVVARGDLLRNEIYRASPRNAALRELTSVPGIGRATAEALYERYVELECTSSSVRDFLLLPEVYASLSKQQKLGVKHFGDFQECVPRAEVAVVERAFRVAAARVWKLSLPAGASEESLLLPPPAGSSSFARSPSFLEGPGGGGERAFAEAVGSYWRGTSVTAGDIDILLSRAPPEATTGTFLDGSPSLSQERRASGGRGQSSIGAPAAAMTKEELVRDLASIRQEMRGLGFELEEGSMSSSPASAAAQRAAAAGAAIAHGASFSGAIRCPVRLLQAAGLSSPPRFRRLDVKLYPRGALPAALCYFSSGTDFSRWIRQWARADSAAARRALLPLAQGAARLAFARDPRLATNGQDSSQADSFHLSDRGLEVTRRGELGSKARKSSYVDGRRVGTRAGAPAAFFSPSIFVPLSCETDIFEALGLEYCPPHMRDLG